MLICALDLNIPGSCVNQIYPLIRKPHSVRKADSFTHRRFSDGDPAAKHKNPITDEELLSQP